MLLWMAKFTSHHRSLDLTFFSFSGVSVINCFLHNFSLWLLRKIALIFIIESSQKAGFDLSQPYNTNLLVINLDNILENGSKMSLTLFIYCNLVISVGDVQSHTKLFCLTFLYAYTSFFPRNGTAVGDNQCKTLVISTCFLYLQYLSSKMQQTFPVQWVF